LAKLDLGATDEFQPLASNDFIDFQVAPDLSRLWAQSLKQSVTFVSLEASNRNRPSSAPPQNVELPPSASDVVYTGSTHPLRAPGFCESQGQKREGDWTAWTARGSWTKHRTESNFCHRAQRR